MFPEPTWNMRSCEERAVQGGGLWSGGSSPPDRPPRARRNLGAVGAGNRGNPLGLYWARNDWRQEGTVKDGIERPPYGQSESSVRTGPYSGSGVGPERPGNMNGDGAPPGLCGVT